VDSQIVVPITLLLMLTLLLGGAWIFVAIGGSAVLGLIMLGDISKLAAAVAWGAANSWTLSAVPLFVLMGEIIFHSGLSNPLYHTISLWLRRLPGGLLHTNVAASALFASISGSTIATCATVGTMAIPEQRKRGYDEKLILGSVAAAGSLGVLIPPSINMILYASWVDVSLGKLFAGGILPGIMMSILFMAYIGFACWRNPSLAPAREQRASLLQRLASLKGVIPFLIIAIIIWGGIFTGWMTPTEAAGVSAFAALVMAAVTRRLTRQVIKDAFLGTVRITCMTMATYIGATLLVTLVGYTGVTKVLVNQIEALHLGKMATLFAIYGIYIVLGCFLDGIALMLVTIPFIVPILTYHGIDLIWFGVTLILLMEMSFLTPPVGINLFVVAGIANTDMSKVVRGIVPFFVMLFIGIVIVTFVPDVVMLLPNAMAK